MKRNEMQLKEMIAAMTVEEKILLLHGQTMDKYRANQAGFVHGISRLGIPDVFIADGESGVNVSWEATALPAKVGLAATFDRETARLYGEVIGREAKAAGMHMVLTPRVNLVRSNVVEEGKSNGGNYQTYGEDPVLNGKLGAAEVEGIQHNGQAAANVKQIFGSSTGTAQGAGNSIMDAQSMHEVYLKAFEEPVKAGAASIMTSYNQVNGKWTYGDEKVISGVIRDKWGFRGPCLCDWFCLYNPDALRRGVTLEMPGEDYYGEGSERSWYGKRLLEAVNRSDISVSMEDIDRAVFYYIDMLNSFGMLDEQRLPGPISDAVKQKGMRDAVEIARKTAVLLKNESAVLPLDVKKDKIAVIGVGGIQQVMPIFKEASYGFKDRRNGVYQVLKDRGVNVSFSVGIDLEGTVIPAQYLYTDNTGINHGLIRFESAFSYDTLADGELACVPNPTGALTVDEKVDFSHGNGLDLPKEGYYHWKGQIIPPETGWYRLNVQQMVPGVDVFERNQIENSDMMLMTTGNLYWKPEEEKMYQRIGIGSRTAMNGGAVPNSEVVTTKEGWNLVGGYVFMEAGKGYDIYFNAASIYKEPVEVRFSWVIPSDAQKNVTEAVKTAKDADKVLLFTWQRSTSSSLKLPGMQNELIEAVAKANKNVIVILNNGDPIEMPWINRVKGILEMWYAGQEGAHATADILAGNYNPGGKLPVTFPVKLEDTAVYTPLNTERRAKVGRKAGDDVFQQNIAYFTEGVNIGYRWFESEHIEPLFPFGFGLSYTTFRYDDIKVARNADHGYDVTCLVENTGECSGDAVIQCYLGKCETVPEGIQASPKILADFKRVTLTPGEQRRAELRIRFEELSYYDENSHSWKVYTGRRKVMLGDSSSNMILEKVIYVD